MIILGKQLHVCWVSCEILYTQKHNMNTVLVF